MKKIIDWKEVYEAVPKAIKLTLNGRELELGKHYDIADIAHTACKGRPPYVTGTLTVILKVVEEKGRFYLVKAEADEPLPGEIIRIADRLYTLKRGGKQVINGSVLDGSISKYDQVIYIADDLSPELEQETVIHEILHGCIEMYTPEMRQQLSVDDEERFVTALARGLAETINANARYFLLRSQGGNADA